MSAPGPPVLPGRTSPHQSPAITRALARRLAGVVGILLILLLTCVLAAQELWYASYQQGVDAFKRNEYALAKRKFVEAINNKQAPKTRGRRVLYYGLLRDEFMPEYYLAIIAAHDKQWDEAVRYADAAEAYMRGDKDLDKLTAARATATNARNSLPPATTTALVTTNTIKPPVPTSTIGPTTTVPPVVDTRAAAQRQSDSLIGQGNRALANGSYANAREFARQARTLGVDTAAADELLKRVATAEQAAHDNTRAQITSLLGQRNWAAAGDLLDRFARDGGDQAFVTSSRTAIARGLDQDAARGLEHAAVTAFYKGNYQAALGTFARMSPSQITPRVLFYQACTNAALALVEGPAGASRLTRARALYARSDPKRNSFERHRRFVSPQIIRALEQ
jgi:hypothetical protein